MSEDEFPDETYPTYIIGGGYLITTAAVSEILMHTSEVAWFPIEDALWTGVLAKLAGVKHIISNDYFRIDGEVCCSFNKKRIKKCEQFIIN